ncbi:ABC transporter permease [Neobacillus mesonae]|uniref:ABC transporter permease n=1 Tax=Neobacillus mesonae TaxID=1193713 RepID=UPI00257448EF|nr:sugar ABC transporter permease [Neobacillus mesonae]MED4203581.1 sugar ABC transporter permease [Neobacillus mesonae]
MTNIIKLREFRTFLFLIVLFLVVGLVNSDYLSLQNIDKSLKSSLLYIVLAVGMTFVLLTGNLDISVGGTLGLTAAVCGTILRDGGSILTAVIVAILIGAGVGLINGFGVIKLNISSFIMTLAILSITRVLQVIYTNGKWVENIPAKVKGLSNIDFFGINVLTVIVMVGVILVQLYLTKSSRGRYYNAIGDNRDGAVSLGIPVNRYIAYSFVISGICAALAGLIFVSQIGFVSTNAGAGIELTVIAACVLGGVSLIGGIGTVVGAALGAIILTSINSALVYMKVPAFWNSTISGSLLIIIVVIDALLAFKAKHKARKVRLNARVLQKEAHD